MLPYVWMAVVVVALLLEAITMGLISIWFVPGALVSLALSLVPLALHWQLIAFAAVSAVTLILGVTIKRKKTKTNVDSVIGKTALIIEEVNNVEGRGAAKLNGQVWSARSKNPDETLVPGDHVIVLAVEGVKLICRKKI
jgi:membrane protein implicated in regulation of membrane protease activity